MSGGLYTELFNSLFPNRWFSRLLGAHHSRAPSKMLTFCSPNTRIVDLGTPLRKCFVTPGQLPKRVTTFYNSTVVFYKDRKEQLHGSLLIFFFSLIHTYTCILQNHFVVQLLHADTKTTVSICFLCLKLKLLLELLMKTQC